MCLGKDTNKTTGGKEGYLFSTSNEAKIPCFCGQGRNKNCLSLGRRGGKDQEIL
jgi:hypothetical protein